jgi:gliding-associated putative ABC transporter substrate-binding component GldG
MKASKRQNIKQLALIILLVIAVNFLGNYFFKRFDLTQDKRYTLSETSLNIIGSIDSPLIIDVFLEGIFPPEFKRLQDETKQLLEEFSAHNPNIVFQFANPIQKEEERVEVMKKFYERGLQPLNITVENKGKQSQEVVFPWAVASYGDRSTKVSLLKNLMGASTEEKVISSVQHLEFAFAEELIKYQKTNKRKLLF